MQGCCEKCGELPKYRHPQTGKIYKLCAKCGREALTKVLNFSDGDDKSDTEKVDEILILNIFAE